MIISHRHRFIFVKTRKTAGTSIELALSRFCGPDDIITAQDSEDARNPVNEALLQDEKLRLEQGYPPPQHHYVPLLRYSGRQWRRLLIKGIRARHKKHASAASIAARWPAEWNSYFRFCVERNPWDKAVSLYYWFTGGRRYAAGTLHDVLASDEERVSNWHLYAIDDRPAVDHVVRYEDLDAELDRIAGRLGLPGRIELPRAKGDFRQDRRSYREVLDQDAKALIDRLCAREIEYFGYRF